jgi:CRP/FNR family cyclic AMP-dependent transcriptional regulator
VFSAILDAAQDLPEITVPDATELITEGVVPGRLLILVAGAVSVSRDGTRFSMVDEPGTVFGEMSVLLDVAATATVHSMGEARFRVADAPAEFLRSKPEVSLAVAELLARRVDYLLRYLTDVKAQYADRADHLGVVDVVLESLAHHQRSPVESGSDREREAPY